jgi:hypothetical protein
VDHAIARLNVGLRHVGVVDANLAVPHLDGDRVAAHRLRGLQLHDISRTHLASHDVIREDAAQLVLVLRLEQALQRAGRQLRECGVRRREHRERTGPFEGSDKIRRGQGLGERRERPRRDRRVDDVFCLLRTRGRRRQHHGERERGERKHGLHVHSLKTDPGDCRSDCWI